MSLTTLKDIKTWLAVTDTSQDAILTMLQNSVEASIVKYCETDFDSHAKLNEILDGQRQDIVVPENFPIISVQGLRVGTYVDGSGGIPLNTITDIIVREYEIALRSAYTAKGRGYVALDYTYGYAEIPPQVKMAAILGVEGMYRRKTRGNIGIRSRGKEGETESYSGMWDDATGLPAEVVKMLAPYRHMEFPVSAMATRSV